MNKKLAIVSVAAVGALAVGSLIPMAVFAADASGTAGTFVQKLATKLGLDQTAVQTAVESVHSEIRAEHETEFIAGVQQAVTDSKLTQRQADILLAIHDVRSELAPGNRPDREDLSGLTTEERQTKKQELHEQRQQELVDALNAKGLNTTAAEVEATHEAARTAGVGGPMGGRGMGRGGMMR